MTIDEFNKQLETIRTEYPTGSTGRSVVDRIATLAKGLQAEKAEKVKETKPKKPDLEVKNGV